MNDLKFGIQLFIFERRTFQYSKYAKRLVDDLRKHADVPIQIVTDDRSYVYIPRNVDRVDFLDENEVPPRGLADWVNWPRIRSLELSPFRRTLVMDVDMRVGRGFSEWIDVFRNHEGDFWMPRRIMPVNPCPDFYRKIGHEGRENIITLDLPNTEIPMYWATMMLHDKTERTRRIFDDAQRIADDYDLVSSIHGWSDGFRNDHVFSLAAMWNGGVDELPLHLSFHASHEQYVHDESVPCIHLLMNKE